jgi:predicted phosphodiesterase
MGGKMIPVHIIPDAHIPFHDRKAWALNLAVIKARKPQVLIILGDFGDFYSVSSHQKNPKHRNLLLMDEVAAVNAELDKLDAAVPKSCKKYFIQGNHEERLDRYVSGRAPDLFGVCDTPNLFRLKERGWHYTPYRQHVKIGKVYYTHDTGKAGASAHTAAERAFSDNAVIGHTHRMAYNVQGNTRGSPHVAAMFGWLGDINAAEYMHQINARRDWTIGFGTGWMQPNGVTFLQPHPIVNYTACVDGVLYK